MHVILTNISRFEFGRLILGRLHVSFNSILPWIICQVSLQQVSLQHLAQQLYHEDKSKITTNKD